MEDDPESPLGLSQSNNLVFYISRNHDLATRVDDVPHSPETGLIDKRKVDQCCIGCVHWEIWRK